MQESGVVVLADARTGRFVVHTESGFALCEVWAGPVPPAGTALRGTFYLPGAAWLTVGESDRHLRALIGDCTLAWPAARAWMEGGRRGVEPRARVPAAR